MDTISDPHQPQYHFRPPANWLNDPNGFIQWGSTYHLFYQYNPNGAFHGTIHWGHAVSPDLVQWEHLPIALAPTPGGPDARGCWSGCAVDDGGVPTVIYSGDSPVGQRPCLATSSDGLLTLQKYPGNPIIAEPPPDLDLVAYRDHCVWREGDDWYQIIGAGIRDQGGSALLYRSADLRAWTYMHPLAVGDQHRHTPIWTGSMWECPDFFPLGDRHVLIISIWDAGQLYYSVAMIGDYRDHRFAPRLEHKLDYGDSHFYAPQSMRDRSGRRVVIGWAKEGRSVDAQRAAGWSGAMSLPRELTLGADGDLRVRPVTELAGLRAEHTRVEPQLIPADHSLPVPQVAGNALELDVVLEPAREGRCGLAVRRAPDGAEETLIVYDSALRQLVVERARASRDDDTERTPHMAPLALAMGEPLRLRVFLDHSILEVFANERVSITTRIYPTRADSLGVALLAERGDGRLLGLDAWQMRSIWAE